jgi:NAD(P)-dependent dehydrogenase (short-subunit alcohol dehydrogenase family)
VHDVAPDAPTMETLAGSRVVVTGSSSGIGKAVAEMFCREGAFVAGLDIVDGALTSAACGDGFTPIPCDLSDPAEIARAFQDVDEAFAGASPDVLACVAGICAEVAFLDSSAALFDAIFAVNVRGVMLCGQEAGRRMRDRGRGGRIVNIASTASVQAWQLQSVYGASKGAVSLLTRCMALELGQYGILVNAVGPGTIVTPGSKEFLSDERVLANELGRVPLDRIGQPEDIAAAVRFLARDARWMTGQTVYVDGGFLVAGLTVPVEGAVTTAL